ncbi:hypothetical protein FEM48_Zijuj10G0115100 [Ziziphus jujuba var. spinosa]|uniref:Vacuolar iron transporter n=1 Tax=Ziziphus jujuba var. spinosa TaxID=714518 RepID=A0A978UN46_ZIZJJ|nr:hypothetical protein FEM48_Zijuj10G0115100 [Ziziphus jujuba var. spinosa]
MADGEQITSHKSQITSSWGLGHGRDIIIGVSDGHTVPFALAAGLSGADVTFSIILIAGIEAVEVAEILAQYGAEQHEYGPTVNAFRRDSEAWVDYIMKRDNATAAIHGDFSGKGGCGGVSVVITTTAWLIFGFAKGYFTNDQPFKIALQTAFTGAIAASAAAAYAIAKIFGA